MLDDASNTVSLAEPPQRQGQLKLELSRLTSVDVPNRTKCKIIDRSDVRCAGPLFTSVFVRVSISSGARRGTRGIFCEADLVRTVAFP